MCVTCPMTLDLLSVKLCLPGLPGLASVVHLLILILLSPQPGEIQRNPNDKCTFLSCVKINNHLISSVSNIICPDFNPSDCVPVSGTPMACLCMLCQEQGTLTHQLPGFQEACSIPFCRTAFTYPMTRRGTHLLGVPWTPFSLSFLFRAPSHTCLMAAVGHVSTAGEALGDGRALLRALSLLRSLRHRTGCFRALLCLLQSCGCIGIRGSFQGEAGWSPAACWDSVPKRKVGLS